MTQNRWQVDARAKMDMVKVTERYFVKITKTMMRISTTMKVTSLIKSMRAP